MTVSWCNQVTVCINSITGTGKEKHNNQNKCGMTSAMSDVEMFWIGIIANNQGKTKT